MKNYPRPGSAPAVVAVPAPGAGPGYWAGAPTAVLDEDGSIVLAYRVRNGHDGIDQNVVARSHDGETFTPLFVLEQGRFGAEWLERPALVRTEDSRWRMWVCAGSPETKRWWVNVLEAESLAGLEHADDLPAFPGDSLTAVKDPIVKRVAGEWRAWLCCHLLDIPGEEDRMNTAYATSPDGWNWTWHGTVLEGRPGTWDARGTRVTAVLEDGLVAYDGRASAAENWFEKSAFAEPAGPNGLLRQLPDSPVTDVRYLEVLTLPDGSRRIFYEARLPDESHELRTELLPD